MTNMNYVTKQIIITEDDVKLWAKTFEKRDIDKINIVPGLCVWSYAHQEAESWVAARIEIKFSKPIFVGETLTISGEIIKSTDKYCKRIITISVGDEIRQTAELKCMPLFN